MITIKINEDHRVKKRLMYCLKCDYEFVSRIAHPRCSKCHTLKVIEYSEIPGYRKDKHFDKKINELRNDIDVLSIKLDQTINMQKKMYVAMHKHGLLS